MAIISKIKRAPVLIIWFVVRLVARNSLITDYALKFLRNRPVLKGRLYRIYQYRTRLQEDSDMDLDCIDNVSNYPESTLLIYRQLNLSLDNRHNPRG